MAKSSWIVFAKESQLGEGELRVKVLQSIFDLLILYGTDFVEEQGFGVSLPFSHFPFSERCADTTGD